MSKLQKLMDDVSDWSDTTFGHDDRELSIVHHLKKEVDELIEEMKKSIDSNKDVNDSLWIKNNQRNKVKNEFADCFTLLIDSAHHFGIDAHELLKISREKLEINKQREWGLPDENGVVEHIRKDI